MAKRVDFEEKSVNLGVETDFSLMKGHRSAAVVTLGVTDERREKLIVSADEVLAEGFISKSVSSRLYGKSRFALCPVFGRVGLGVLHPLSKVREREVATAGSVIGAALVALREVVTVMQPVHFSLFRRKDHAVVAMSDAAFEKTTRTGGVGAIIWCPYRQRMLHITDLELERTISELEQIEWKETYITPLEVAAEVAVYLSFPADWLRGRLVHHFVDNQGALGISVKGTSSASDCSRLATALHVRILALGCQPWFGFVYSEDNLGDDPSRGEFSLLRALGSEEVPCRLPRLVVWPAASL
jgi:hypothetical protein